MRRGLALLNEVLKDGNFITWFQDYWLGMHSDFVTLSRQLAGTSKYLVS